MNIFKILKIRWKYIVISVFVVLANMISDRVFKMLAVLYLKGEHGFSYIHNMIVITYAENNGAFLSLGANWPVLIKYTILLIIPIAACFYGLYYIFFKEKNIIKVILLATILGGGLSNLIDRLFNDFKVIDFLNFGIGNLRTGILNTADLSVTFGLVFLLLYDYKFNNIQSLNSEKIRNWK